MNVSFNIQIASGKEWTGKRYRYNMGAMGALKMQDGPILKFVIEYPLDKPKSVVLMHENGSGWTRQQFVKAVRVEYKKVYAEEEAAVGNPGHVPGISLAWAIWPMRTRHWGFGA